MRKITRNLVTMAFILGVCNTLAANSISYIVAHLPGVSIRLSANSFNQDLRRGAYDLCAGFEDNQLLTTIANGPYAI